MPGLPLAEADYTSLALELAVREVAGWRDILDDAARANRESRSKSAVRVRHAGAVGRSRRSASDGSASLADVNNRRREPWVLEGLGNLHHPLRAEASAKYVAPSLDDAVGNSEDRRYLLSQAVDERDAVGPHARAAVARRRAAVPRATAARLPGAVDATSFCSRRTSCSAQRRCSNAVGDGVATADGGRPGDGGRRGTEVHEAQSGFCVRARRCDSDQPSHSTTAITIRAARVIDGRGQAARIRPSRCAARRSSSVASTSWRRHPRSRHADAAARLHRHPRPHRLALRTGRPLRQRARSRPTKPRSTAPRMRTSR